MNLRCIIVDDEPLSHEVLEGYIAKYPDLTLQAAFFNALDALSFLSENRTDLIFLDINMPELSGIGMLKTLPEPPSVIFTTAYPEYAVDGFDLNITDFLLKPFSFERFVQAVGKAVAGKPLGSQDNESFLTIKSGKKHFRIPTREIIYLESAGDYVKIVTPSGTYIAGEPLKGFESMLPSGDFIRIHRSYLISIPHIGYIEGNRVFVAGHELPLGRQYKDALRTRLHLDS